jgi:hypothetical protein
MANKACPMTCHEVLLVTGHQRQQGSSRFGCNSQDLCLLDIYSICSKGLTCDTHEVVMIKLLGLMVVRSLGKRDMP